MFERIFPVDASHAGSRLDRFLEEFLEDVSLALIKAAIRWGEVTVDSTPREGGLKLREGNVVRICLPEAPRRAMAAEAIPIDVLFEDDHVVVVDKPAGMLAHPTSRVHSGTLLNAVAHHVNIGAGPFIRPLLVHRLDRATSGALVLSKSRRAHARMSGAFHDRLVQKQYIALLAGALPDAAGFIDAPIGGARDRFPGFAVDENGRPARTRYGVVRSSPPFTLAELEPLTGRTNQLRIHAAHVGAPIVGDDLHGLPELAAFYERFPLAPRCDRLFLHASRLVFPHPETREMIDVLAPLPTALAAFLQTIDDG